MNSFQAAILGIVQGLTEYLPISSTAHLRIVPALVGWGDPGAAYSAVIQLGTLLAVFIYFRKDLYRITVGSLRDLRSEARWGADAGMSAAILTGTIPIGIFGIAFKDWIKTDLRSLWVIAGALIILAALLWWSDVKGKRTRVFTALTFWEIQFIGVAQALALIPGVSRSGVTLTAALVIGLRRDEAARFSFLLGIPAIGAAGVFELIELMRADISPEMMSALVIGTVTSFFSGMVAIEVMLRYLKTRSTLVFVIYRFLLGLALIGLMMAGVVR